MTESENMDTSGGIATATVSADNSDCNSASDAYANAKGSASGVASTVVQVHVTKETEATNVDTSVDANTSSSNANADTNHDDQEEQWDLHHIFSIDQLNQEPKCEDDNDQSNAKGPQQCMTKNCPLLACSTYISNLDKEKPWHTCIDCQEGDYGGWPETVSELPVTFMTLEHRRVVVEKCTGQYSPAMPNIPINDKGDFEMLESNDNDTNGDIDNATSTNADEDTNTDTDTDVNTNTNETVELVSSEGKQIPYRKDTAGKESSDTKTTSDILESPGDGNSNGDSESNGDEGEPEEQWDLHHIFSIDQLNQEPKCEDDNDQSNAKGPQQCMTKNCPLLACSTYISNLDKEKPWHTCIDCQEGDYGGWPETVSELPVTFMTLEHRRVVVEKCTGQYSPAMPNIPINDKGDFEMLESNDNDGIITAPSNTSSSSNSSQENESKKPTALPSPGDASKKTKGKKKKVKSMVTPSPVPPSGANGKSRSRLPSLSNHPAYAKWQKECQKLGGGKLVVSKPEIKKMIFELCNDSFAPKNITQIYTVSFANSACSGISISFRKYVLMMD